MNIKVIQETILKTLCEILYNYRINVIILLFKK